MKKRSCIFFDYVIMEKDDEGVLYGKTIKAQLQTYIIYRFCLLFNFDALASLQSLLSFVFKGFTAR